ncbi:MAG TPA: multiheme c-type cytochrome, partial [Polyangia bacterium]
MELLVFCALAAAAAAVLVRGARGARVAPMLALAAALVAASAAAAVAWRARDAAGRRAVAAAAVRAALPSPVADRGYVTSDSCRACHPSEYASWHRSFHRTMTQPTTGATVRAPFAGETLRSDDDGRSYRLYRDGDALWADISGIGARRVPMMTGSHHMEAFWLAGARGNELVEFPFTWLFDDARWVSRRDVFLVGTEYSKRPSTWNRICIECHVTGGVPGFDARATVPSSRVAELGIACEACHGPASAHVAANADPFRRWSLHRSGAADATIVNPARLAAARSAEVCGQCHGIACPPDGWLQHGLGFRPGDALADGKPILRLASLGASDCGAQIAADASFAPSRYWKDGMVRVSGREYNGL